MIDVIGEGVSVAVTIVTESLFPILIRVTLLQSCVPEARVISEPVDDDISPNSSKKIVPLPADSNIPFL